MNTKHLKQRLWLWLLIHLGAADCSPRQFFWTWTAPGFFGIFGLVGDVVDPFHTNPGTVRYLPFFVFLILVSTVFCGMPVFDLRRPRTVEGRMVGCEWRLVKGGGPFPKRYGYRITIADDTGNETIFRGPEVSGLRKYYSRPVIDFLISAEKSKYPDGDIVRAKVGMRLRWLFEIEPIGFTTPPDPEKVRARAEEDRELEARIAADPQAALEELKRKRAELEGR